MLKKILHSYAIEIPNLLCAIGLMVVYNRTSDLLYYYASNVIIIVSVVLILSDVLSSIILYCIKTTNGHIRYLKTHIDLLYGIMLDKDIITKDELDKLLLERYEKFDNGGQ